MRANLGPILNCRSNLQSFIFWALEREESGEQNADKIARSFGRNEGKVSCHVSIAETSKHSARFLTANNVAGSTSREEGEII